MSQVTIFYMQMTDRAELIAKPSPEGLELTRILPNNGAVNQRFYQEVGRDWAWHDRLTWTEGQWSSYAARDGLSTWIAKLDGVEIGYAELESQAGGDVQLCYFGLLPDYIGQGLGGAMLSRVIEIAWAIPGAKRVWLHTCTADHPGARANYESRGFEVYRTERVEVDP